MRHKTMRGLALVLLMGVAACTSGSASSSSTSASVSATVPAQKATAVALNRAITATFDKAIDPSATTTVTVEGVTGTVTYEANSKTAIFTPTRNLTPNTRYTATVTTGTSGAVAASVVGSRTWRFTTGAGTDATPPAVASMLPTSGASGVALNDAVAATFSEPMNPATITTATFTVAGVTGTVTYATNSNTAAFTPNNNLAPNTTYTATMTTGVQDLAGNASASPYVWSFTTGPTASIVVLYSFDGTHGADPKGSLALVGTANGPTLFGRTAFGGSAWNAKDPKSTPGGGVIFSLPSETASPTTYSFTDSTALPTSGYDPHHDSMTLVGSTLYGTALNTGAISYSGSGNGTIFLFNPAFAPPTCATPVTTAYCALYNFAGPAGGGSNADGATSHSAFGVSSDGKTLYGATSAGGEKGDGTLFSVSLSTNPPTYNGPLFSLHNTSTGSDPHGKPIVVNNGTTDVLLGMTKEGGASGLGVIYACLIPTLQTSPLSCTYTLLRSFAGPPGDGATTDHGNLTVTGPPANNLTTLYGMTTNGGTGTNSGSAGDGVVFMLDNLPINSPAPLASSLPPCPNTSAPPTPCYSILHNFGGLSVTNLVTGTQVPDGYSPYGSLLFANGWLYGMTRDGGQNNGGVIFRISPDPTCSNESCYGLLASFDGKQANASGSKPIDNVIVSTDGSTLYGMTQEGGANDPASQQQDVPFGTVFSMVSTP